MPESLANAQKQVSLENPRLRAPRAAAVAGIIFSALLGTSLLLIEFSVPGSRLGPGSWLSGNTGSVELALNLVPFSGIAFLWFIGVVRDRIGASEDRLFATVFLGSGLLFLAMLFASAALAGGLIAINDSTLSPQQSSDLYSFGRTTTYQIMNVYAIKMAGVFMISTSTLGLRTGILPRWMTFLGIALALILIFSIGSVEWIAILFPLWVLMISIYILIVNLRRPQVVLSAEPSVVSD